MAIRSVCGRPPTDVHRPMRCAFSLQRAAGAEALEESTNCRHAKSMALWPVSKRTLGLSDYQGSLRSRFVIPRVELGAQVRMLWPLTWDKLGRITSGTSGTTSENLHVWCRDHGCGCVLNAIS